MDAGFFLSTDGNWKHANFFLRLYYFIQSSWVYVQCKSILQQRKNCRYIQSWAV